MQIVRASLDPPVPLSIGPPQQPMAAPLGDAPLGLDVDMEQLAGPLPLVADHLAAGPVQLGQPEQLMAMQASSTPFTSGARQAPHGPSGAAPRNNCSPRLPGPSCFDCVGYQAHERGDRHATGRKVMLIQVDGASPEPGQALVQRLRGTSAIDSQPGGNLVAMTTRMSSASSPRRRSEAPPLYMATSLPVEIGRVVQSPPKLTAARLTTRARIRPRLLAATVPTPPPTPYSLALPVWRSWSAVLPCRRG